MNTENIIKVRDYWRDEVDPRFVTMENWFSSLLDRVGVDGDSVNDAEEQWGKLGCQTSACLAGHIQHKFANTKEERDLSAATFSQDFLGMNVSDSTILFEECEYYGRHCMHEVLHEDVLEKLNELATAENFKDTW